MAALAGMTCAQNPALSSGSRLTVLRKQAVTGAESSFLRGSGSDWHQASTLSITRRSAYRTVAAQAAVPQDEPAPPVAPSLLVARRHVLAAGGATTASLLLPRQGQAAPVVLSPADLKGCAIPDTATAECCVDFSSGVPPRIPFTPDAGPVRTRKATRNLTPDERKTLNRAYELLRQKADADPTDPRYFMQQANVHCAYCEGYYKYTFNGNQYPLQVHFGWFFLPWHRLYLHFHENILRSLLKTDPEFASKADSFALPFWNYDVLDVNSSDSRIPEVFDNEAGLPSLFDALREHDDQRSPLVSFNGQEPESATDSQIISDNTAIMRKNVLNATTQRLFFGNGIRAGDPTPSRGAGQLEVTLHNAVHNWVGGDTGDMGNFTTAGRDPIFYGGHHASVDRLWSVWLTLPGPGNRVNITDPDWLNASFLFFDENKNLVEAKVSDAINPETSLGYKYEQVPTPWADPRASTAATGSVSRRSLLATDVTQKIDSLGPATSASSAIALNKQPLVISSVERSPPSDLKAGRDPGAVGSLLRSSGVSKFAESAGVGALTVPRFREEVLVLQGVSYPADMPTHLNVFINLPDANPKTPLDIPEYAGSFTTVRMPSMMGMDSSMSSDVEVRLSIGSVLEELGVTDSSNISVTIVPATGGKTAYGDVSVKGISIEYES